MSNAEMNEKYFDEWHEEEVAKYKKRIAKLEKALHRYDHQHKNFPGCRLEDMDNIAEEALKGASDE